MGRTRGSSLKHSNFFKTLGYKQCQKLFESSESGDSDDCDADPPLRRRGKLLKLIASPPCSWVLPIQPLIPHPLSESLFRVIQGPAHLYIYLSSVSHIPIFGRHYPHRYELILSHLYANHYPRVFFESFRAHHYIYLSPAFKKYTYLLEYLATRGFASLLLRWTCLIMYD